MQRAARCVVAKPNPERLTHVLYLALLQQLLQEQHAARGALRRRGVPGRGRRRRRPRKVAPAAGGGLPAQQRLHRLRQPLQALPAR